MVGLACILLVGIAAQWLAWRMRLPSILLLLFAGFAAGPFTGWMDPNEMLGEALLPIVALSVAIILLEGGLTLRFDELAGAGRAVRNLILLGSPLTFALSTLAAHWTLGLEWRLAALIGAILVVTGPTVIIPLLRHVRPTGVVGKVVRWEAIVTDPIGAILAVLVFQAITYSTGPGEAFKNLLIATVAGGALGLGGAQLVIQLMKRDLVPDFLHAGLTLATGLGVFVASDVIQHESGLLAVTLMGVALANQHEVAVEHIVEFKENLRVLLISGLFILLAARVPLAELVDVDLPTIGFVALLIFVVRPVTVFLATLRTELTWRERAFVAWMAPRGIVAAAVSSVFALDLMKEGVPGAERIVPTMFLVIVSTVAVYGLTAAPVARALGLSRGAPQGILLLGAHGWARKLAKALNELKVDTLLVDTNYREIQAARIEGLEAFYGNIFSEHFETTAPIDGIGKLVSMTLNDEVNALACLHFHPEFGRSSVFQLSPAAAGPSGEVPRHLRGRVFGPNLRYFDLENRFRKGAKVKRTKLTDEFTIQDFRRTYHTEERPVIELFCVDEAGQVRVASSDVPLEPRSGETLLAVVDEPNVA